MCGRQTTFEKHSHSQFLALNEIRDSREKKFHVTRISIHLVASLVAFQCSDDIGNLTPLATYNVSDTVLFPDETSQKHVSIQGRFPQAILGADAFWTQLSFSAQDPLNFC